MSATDGFEGPRDARVGVPARRCQLARDAGAAGLLDHVEGSRDQDVAAERKDHGGGVKRPDATEIEPRQIEVEDGPLISRR